MSSRFLRTVVVTGTLLLVSHGAQAQQPSGLLYLIGNTYEDSRADLNRHIANNASFQGASSEPYDLEGTLGSALAYDTAAFPIGSSSAGFTYSFNEASGAALRSSPSFGPLFAERPLTSGRGNLNVGFTYMHRSMNRLEGRGLNDGSLKFFTPLEYTGTTLNVDLIQSTFNLGIQTDTATLFATYGLLDKLDVSVAVPIQKVNIDATVTSELVRFGPSSASAIPAGAASQSGSASGVGDIAVRAKYNLLNAAHSAVAAGMDMRLPTGDEMNLLGTGRTRTKIYASVSGKTPKLFPHANFGYTFQSDDNADSTFWYGSEFSYAAGAEYVVHPRVTILGDFLGRSLADEGRLQEQTRTVPLVQTITRPAEALTVTQLALEPGLPLNRTLAAIGAKFNPGSTFVVSGHLLFSMSDAGLTSHPTPVLSIDYSF